MPYPLTCTTTRGRLRSTAVSSVSWEGKRLNSLVIVLVSALPQIHMRWCRCGGLVVIRSLRTALDIYTERRRKNAEEERSEHIYVYNSRGGQFQFTTLETSAMQLRQRYLHAQNNRLINPRCLESRETLKQRRSATALLESPS